MHTPTSTSSSSSSSSSRRRRRTPQQTAAGRRMPTSSNHYTCIKRLISNAPFPSLRRNLIIRGSMMRRNWLPFALMAFMNILILGTSAFRSVNYRYRPGIKEDLIQCFEQTFHVGFQIERNMGSFRAFFVMNRWHQQHGMVGVGSSV